MRNLRNWAGLVVLGWNAWALGAAVPLFPDTGDKLEISCAGELKVEGTLTVGALSWGGEPRRNTTGKLEITGKNKYTGAEISLTREIGSIIDQSKYEAQPANTGWSVRDWYDGIVLSLRHGASQIWATTSPKPGEKHELTCSFRHVPHEPELTCYERGVSGAILPNGHTVTISSAKRASQSGTVTKVTPAGAKNDVFRAEVKKTFTLTERENRLRYTGSQFLLSIDLDSSVEYPWRAGREGREWHLGVFRSGRTDLGIGTISLLCQVDDVERP